MSAVSASAAIGAKPAAAAGQRVQSTRKRSVATQKPTAGDAAATPVRGRDVATSSANGDAGGADVALLSHPKDLSNALRTGQDEVAGQQQPATKHKRSAALPPNSKESPLKYKSVRHKESHIAVRRKPSSFLDLTGHFFSRFFLILVIAVGLGSSWWTWRTRPQFSNSGQITTEVEKLEEFVAKTTKWMQVQLDAVDKKIGHEVGVLKKDFHKELDSHQLNVATEVKNLKEKFGKFGATLDSLFSQGAPITQKEALELIKEVVDKRAAEGKGRAFSLDDVRTAARQVVIREIERHSADGIGRVDYALGSGGGRVIAHSEGYYVGSRGDWHWGNLLGGSHRLHAFAEKLLQPSYGEPGQCLPLKGNNVWVDIALRTTIRPDAITLEHVSKDNAYDVSSGPKEFRLFGWRETRGQRDVVQNPVTMISYGEFTYDTEKANVQTFSLAEDDVAGALINMIRVHVLSNHGSPTHTCIYRVRMHGSDPAFSLAPKVAE
ncbi:unnamed protein product [Calypogeia fissa]